MKLGFPIPNCREGRDKLPGEITPRGHWSTWPGNASGWVSIPGGPTTTSPTPGVDGVRVRPAAQLVREPAQPVCHRDEEPSESSSAWRSSSCRSGSRCSSPSRPSPWTHFSNGRLLLGIGLGDSRAEFVSIKPREAKAHRGRMLDEGLEAVSRLLSEPESSFDGESYAHDGVILYPRPVQDPLPIYIAGHSPTTPQRIARHAHGWLVSYPSLRSFKADWPVVEEAMHAQGRAMSELDITTTWGMRLDRTREKALANYKKSAQERLKTSGTTGEARRLVHGEQPHRHSRRRRGVPPRVPGRRRDARGPAACRGRLAPGTAGSAPALRRRGDAAGAGAVAGPGPAPGIAEARSKPARDRANPRTPEPPNPRTPEPPNPRTPEPPNPRTPEPRTPEPPNPRTPDPRPPRTPRPPRPPEPPSTVFLPMSPRRARRSAAANAASRT